MLTEKTKKRGAAAAAAENIHHTTDYFYTTFNIQSKRTKAITHRFFGVLKNFTKFTMLL